MSEQNFCLLIQSKFSKPSNISSDSQTHNDPNNKIGSKSVDGLPAKAKTIKKINPQLLAKTRELQIAHQLIAQYQHRQTQWKEEERILKQQIAFLRKCILQTQEEMEILKNNHNNQIQFYLRKQRQMLTTISTFVYTNSIQRQENQTQNDETPSEPTDPIQTFIQNTLENVREIGIRVEEIGKLPQMIKLLKQTSLTGKKLNWYLAEQPFFEKDEHVRQNLIDYLMRVVQKQDGIYFFEELMHLLNDR